MKTRFLGFLCTALLTAGIFLGATTAFAHSTPYEETILILDDIVEGDGWSEIVPRQSTLKEARKAIVRAGLADDYQKKDFTGDGMRFVNYTFNYGEKFVFRAVTGADDTRPADELTITSYDVMGRSARTLGGLCVGMEYADVAERYGEASFLDADEEDITSYIYTFIAMAAELAFDVDDAGIIQAIRFRSEI